MPLTLNPTISELFMTSVVEPATKLDESGEEYQPEREDGTRQWQVFVEDSDAENPGRSETRKIKFWGDDAMAQRISKLKHRGLIELHGLRVFEWSTGGRSGIAFSCEDITFRGQPSPVMEAKKKEENHGEGEK